MDVSSPTAAVSSPAPASSPDEITDEKTAAAGDAPTTAASSILASWPAPASVPVTPSAAGSRPECYMIVTNVTKSKNVGNLMRSCVAFGVTEMIIVGANRIQTFGAHGTDRFMRVTFFHKPREAISYLKGKGVTICGIEITPDAAPVHTHPFRGPTAFIPGSEGDGLCDAHKALCDHFVYIPQYGNGTASLNVTVATSIVLHHFALWAGYPERGREAGRDKFVVEAPPGKDGSMLSESDLALRAQRAARRAAKAEEGAGIECELGGVGPIGDVDGDDE